LEVHCRTVCSLKFCNCICLILFGPGAVSLLSFLIFFFWVFMIHWWYSLSPTPYLVLERRACPLFGICLFFISFSWVTAYTSFFWYWGYGCSYPLFCVSSTRQIFCGFGFIWIWAYIHVFFSEEWFPSFAEMRLLLFDPVVLHISSISILH